MGAAASDAAGSRLTAQVFRRRQLFHRVDDALRTSSCARGSSCRRQLAAYIFPSLDSFELYRVAGQPVFLPLWCGRRTQRFSCSAELPGIRWSASFQNWTTGSCFLLFVLLLGISADRALLPISSGVSHDSLRINPAYAADRAYFMTDSNPFLKWREAIRISFDRIFRGS